MKTKVILVAFFLINVLSGCKNNSAKENVEAEKKEAVVENQFKVTLTATVKKDDNFQLYYNETTFETPYKEENAIWVEVKGSETPQEITFSLPVDVIPNYLRLDIGINDKQDPITINNFKIDYLKKQFNVNGASFFDYFTISDCIEVNDKPNGLIKTFKNKSNIYDPLFYSGENLKAELEKLIK